MKRSRVQSQEAPNRRIWRVMMPPYFSFQAQVRRRNSSRPISSRLSAFLGQHFLHLQLGGDPGVVGPRDPQGRDPFHAVVADHQVFHRDEHGMTQVKLAGHVRRRDGNHEGLRFRIETRQVGIIRRLEVALLFPPLVEALLCGFEIICLRQFLSTMQ